MARQRPRESYFLAGRLVATLGIRGSQAGGLPRRLATICLPHETGVAREADGTEIPQQNAEAHSHAVGTNVILNGLSALEYQGLKAAQQQQV